MKFVSEDIIDEVVESINDEEDSLEAFVTSLQERQPVLFGYVFSENLEILHQEERELVLFLLLTIFLASEKVNGIFETVEVEVFEDAEEKNWELLERGTSAQSFRERLDVFFEKTSQEDLLAFVEDALSDSEDGLTTKEGREVVFVFLKSVIDCLEVVGK